MVKLKEIASKFIPRVIGLGLNTLAIVSPKRAAQQTLDIFCTPRNGRIKPYQAKFLSKFTKKVLQYGNIEIATYEYAGTGPRILLCHGWESNSFRWRKLFKKLKKQDYHIIMMDAPAHGETSGSKFTALLYAEMINEVASFYQPQILCGHSVGGMSVILYLGMFKPAYIQSAVILAAPDRLSDITDNYFGIIGGSRRLRQSYNLLIPEVFGNDISYYSAAAFATGFNIPSLIIHDEGDQINKYEEGLRIHKAWEGSLLKPTSGLGHSLQSEVVFEAITDFFKNQKLTKV